MSSSTTVSVLPYTCWAVDSDPHVVILAINATYIPEPVGQNESPLVRVDGLWGPHEWICHPQPFDPNAPWLAFIRTPKVNKREDISLRPPSKTMWQRHPEKAHLHVMTKEVSDEFTVLWQQMQHFKNHELPDLGKRINTAPIQRTDYRALQCYMRLKEGGLESWEDFLDNYWMLQRCLLEHETFQTWH